MLEDLILMKSFAILSISNATQEQEDAAELFWHGSLVGKGKHLID